MGRKGSFLFVFLQGRCLRGGMCGFFKVGLNCSREAAFARRKRRKAAGGNAKGVSPGPPRAYVRLCERLQCGAALVAEDCQNFRLTRKQSSAKSPHGFLCGLSGSRTGLEERGRVACDSLTFGELLSPNLLHIPHMPNRKNTLCMIYAEGYLFTSASPSAARRTPPAH